MFAYIENSKNSDSRDDSKKDAHLSFGKRQTAQFKLDSSNSKISSQNTSHQSDKEPELKTGTFIQASATPNNLPAVDEADELTSNLKSKDGLALI